MTFFNEDNTVERMVLHTLSGTTPYDMVGAEKQNIYPQITQIDADSNSKINLRKSAKSADKTGVACV